jgi:GntR family transcriptional regulator
MKIREDPRPLYIRAEEALAELIGDRYQPGDRLPPEPKLARQLGISRSTLREALRSFEEQALITRRQGVGTFVNVPCPVIESGLETMVSLDSLAQDKGLRCTTRDLTIQQRPASEETAQKLGVAQGTPVVVVSRIKVTNGKPLAFMYDVLPVTIAPLEEVKADFQGSVLDLLLYRGSPALSHAWANIVSTEAGPSLAEKLDVSATSALLLLEEFLYSTSGSVVEYSQNYFVPGFFRFHVVRRIPLTVSSPTGLSPALSRVSLGGTAVPIKEVTTSEEAVSPEGAHAGSSEPCG